MHAESFDALPAFSPLRILTSWGAEIDTRSDGIVIDVLNIADKETKKGATAERCHQIAETLMEVWETQDDIRNHPA